MANSIIYRVIHGQTVYAVGSPSAGYSWTADRTKAHEFPHDDALRIAREYNRTAFAADGEARVIDWRGSVSEVNEASASYKVPRAKKRGFLVHIPADVSQPIRREEFKGKAPEYAALRKAVGGLIQPLKLKYEGRARDGYVNEEGLLHRLPLNPRASRMWAECYAFATPLVGNAVLIYWEKVAEVQS